MSSATKGHLLWYTGRLAVVGLLSAQEPILNPSPLTAGKTAPDRRVIRHQSGVSFIEKPPDEKERLKAAELLGKRYGLYTDKVDLDADAELHICIDYGDGSG